MYQDVRFLCNSLILYPEFLLSHLYILKIIILLILYYLVALNEVPELEKAELMPAKWQILIELSQQLIINQQKT